MICSAQVSVYPLRQEHLGPAIDVVRTTLQAHSLPAEVGPMSTIVTGEAAIVFAALAEAFDKTAQSGQVVMTFTVSNACPVRWADAGTRFAWLSVLGLPPPASSARTPTRGGAGHRWARSSRRSSAGSCCAWQAICGGAPCSTWDAATAR